SVPRRVARGRRSHSTLGGLRARSTAVPVRSVRGRGRGVREPLPRTEREAGGAVGGVRLGGAQPGCDGYITPDQPGPRRDRAGGVVSATQTEALDEAAVAVDVDLLQVAEQATALADEEEQTTTAVVVVLVLLEVLGEVLDALREERDLHLGRTGVALARRVLGHDALLRGSVERHGSPSGSLRGAPGRISR